MSEDRNHVILSEDATAIANRLKESGHFVDALSAARFGMAYAIKLYWSDIETEEKVLALNELYDNRGSSYNIGSVDQDQTILEAIKILYPNTEIPYRLVRTIMCYGLNRIGDIIEDKNSIEISKMI